MCVCVYVCVKHRLQQKYPDMEMQGNYPELLIR